jgi:hypothetical protein
MLSMPDHEADHWLLKHHSSLLAACHEIKIVFQPLVAHLRLTPPEPYTEAVTSPQSRFRLSPGYPPHPTPAPLTSGRLYGPADPLSELSRLSRCLPKWTLPQSHIYSCATRHAIMTS